MQAGARHIGQQSRRTPAGGFLEHKVVALQVHRVTRNVERNVIVTAERQRRSRIELSAGNLGFERDLSGSKHIRRHGDDSGTRAHRTLGRHDVDAVAIPLDARNGRRQSNWKAGRKSSDQRAVALPAKSIVFTFRHPRKVRRRDRRKILAAGEWSKHEFDRRPPVTKIGRQSTRRRTVRSAPTRIDDSATGAHHGGNKALQLGVARIARTDANRLAPRGGIDVECRRLSRACQKIAARPVNPVRAEIKGDAKDGGIGDAAPPDPIARLEQDKPAVGGSNAPRRSNAGGTGSDNRHIEVGAALRAHDRRRRDNCRGDGEE